MDDQPEVFYFEELPSTNIKIKELFKERLLSEFSAVIAGFQTAGRGLVGNHWESERNQNLTFSFLLKPIELEVTSQFIITQIVSLALSDWLNLQTDNVSIKWPNDIYIGDCKVAGMLIENNLSGKMINSSVVGIGLNLNQERFCSNAPNPVALTIYTGRKYNIEQVFQECMQIIIERYYNWMDSGDDAFLHTQYINRLYRNKGLFPYRDQTGEFMASVKEVESDGHLILETDFNDVRRYAFKEVEFVR